MLTGYELSMVDVFNVSVSGFLIVFVGLAILYAFVNILSWTISKLQKSGGKE